MMAHNSDKEWERFGKSEPYYGVVTLDKYRTGRITPEAKAEFFRTGEDHIEFVLDQIRKRLDPAFAPVRAMDFGCGVGRCAIPLAKHCQEVVGVDVSDSMLEEARRECEARSLTNVTLVKSDDELSRLEGCFDLIHSFITFQHIPPHRGEHLFARQVALVSDGGAGAVQFVYHRNVAAAVRLVGWMRRKIPFVHNILNLASGKPLADPVVEKNCYDLNRLFRILELAGCERVSVMFEGEGPLRSVILFFQKIRDRLPYESFYNDGKAAE